MNETSHNAQIIPISARIQQRLEELDKTPAWLADMVGVSRSTITRILKRERNPAPETLHEIAPVLGVQVDQLVYGTDAAERVREAQDIVSRRDYEAAIHQVVEFERKANDLASRARELNQECGQERERNRKLREDLERTEREHRLAQLERDRARQDALRNERDARRYREGLERAVADVARLRTQVRELGNAVKAGQTTARVGAILAGVAAAVSVANYLSTDDDESSAANAEKKTSRKRKRGEK